MKTITLLFPGWLLANLEKLTASAQRICALFDEEIDKARRDEANRRGSEGGRGN